MNRDSKHHVISFFVLHLELDTIKQLTVTVVSNTSVNISWEPPLLTNGIILRYDINIRSLTVRPFNDSVSIAPMENLNHLIQNLS